MTIAKKVSDALRQDGLFSLPRKTALYFSRRLAWRTDRFTKELDYSIAARTLAREYRNLLARNEIFRNRHRGRRCFVLGNGPSLNSQDLTPLAGELTFVTNAFCKSQTVSEWQPSYYFLSDPVYFDGSEAARELFAELNSRVHETTYFVPHRAREVIARDHLLKPEQTFYVAMAGNLAHKLSWTPDFTRILPDVRTVAQFAIMGAMFMGCSPIYLLGMDHDWLAHRGEHTNFYQGKDMKTQITLDDWRYGDLMEAILIMWLGYESIQKVAESLNIRIVNATHGGFLDVFERGCYESVLQE